MKRNARALLLGMFVALVPGMVCAQMTGMGGSMMPTPGAAASGTLPAIPSMIYPMYSPTAAMAVGDDGTAYLLLDADYSDPKAIKTPVTAVPLPGASVSTWKTSVSGVANTLVAGTNAIVIGESPAAIPMALTLTPGTPTTVTNPFPPLPVATPKSTLYFLKPASGATFRDSLSLEGYIVSLTIKKVGTSEYVYALARVVSVIPIMGVPSNGATVPSPILPKLKLTVISLTQNWVQTVDLATGQVLP